MASGVGSRRSRLVVTPLAERKADGSLQAKKYLSLWRLHVWTSYSCLQAAFLTHAVEESWNIALL